MKFIAKVQYFQTSSNDLYENNGSILCGTIFRAYYTDLKVVRFLFLVHF